MARLAATEFLERLAKGKPAVAILLLGEEAYLRDLCRAQLIENFVPEAARVWAVSRFSAAGGETLAALDQAQTRPLLASHQVVFLEEAEAIEKLGEKARETAVAALVAYLSDPAPFTVLVVEAAKLDMRMQLGKKLAERVLVVEVALGDRPEERQSLAVQEAKRIAEREGVAFEEGAAEDLAERVNAELVRLQTEIVKLGTYVGERKTIRREDVAALVLSEQGANIWEVADLLAKRQPRKALEYFDRLLREGEEPVMMLGGMAWMFRKLVEASELRGVANSWQAAKALGMRPEQADEARECARRFPKEHLLEGLRTLQEADSRLKGGVKEVRAVMEFALWRLSGGTTSAS